MNVTDLLRSRDNWKSKQVRTRRSLDSQKRLAKKWKSRCLDTRRKLEDSRKYTLELENQLLNMSTPANCNIIINIRVICIMLFIMGVVPANAVPRLLRFLNEARLLSLSWIPSPASVVNYISRAGLGMLNSVNKTPQKFIAILDTSIAYGKEKALVVIRVMLDHFATNSRAPCLSDAECIGLDISDSWTGENICAALTRIFDRAGQPLAILKDGGADLSKGVDLLREKFPGIFELQDIGHVAANILKNVYAEKKGLSHCLNLINSGRKRLCHSKYSSLRPPGIRNKGRFQGISRVLEWMKDILQLIGGPGSVGENTVAHALRKAFPGLGKARHFADRFRRDCLVLNDFMKVFKNQGLNQQSCKEGRKILGTLSERSSIRKVMLRWMSSHLQIHCRMSIGQTGLLVSSDSIESLMGSIKSILERSPRPEFGTLTLAVPLLCGRPTQQSVEDSLMSCPHKMLTNWRSEMCKNTHQKVRRRFLPQK